VDDQEAESFTDKPVYIKGVGMSSDTSYVTERQELTAIPSVREATAIAKREAKVDRVDFAELHDMATILVDMQSRRSDSSRGVRGGGV